MTDFIPCPFCGTEGVSVSPLEAKDERRYYERVAECHSCEAKIARHVGWSEYRSMGEDRTSTYLLEKIVEAWNSRMSDDQPDVLSNEETLKRVANFIENAMVCKCGRKWFGWTPPSDCSDYIARCKTEKAMFGNASCVKHHCNFSKVSDDWTNLPAAILKIDKFYQEVEKSG